MQIDIFNLIEGFFWIAFGLWMLLAPKQSFISHYKPWLGIILIIFGLSDFVEMTTGAWWQPWWLLVWKAACLVIGLILIILIRSKGGSHEEEH